MVSKAFSKSMDSIAEILDIAIRRSEGIAGFKFTSKELKLSQYADDMQILLDGSENSIRNIVKLLDSYTEISGLKVNYNKSELAPLGKSRMEIYTHSECFNNPTFLFILGGLWSHISLK
jgi:hypothetical protein